MAEHVDTADRELTSTPAEPADVTDDPVDAMKQPPRVESEYCEPKDPGAVEDPDDVEDYDAVDTGDDAGPSTSRRPISPVRLAVLVGVIAVIVLGALTGWLGFGAYRVYQAEQLRHLFLQTARQGAINLTTIDWEHADSDVARILDSASGTLHDDFAVRSQPLVEAVKTLKSKSVGTIIEAGVESMSGDAAQVLVVASVKTTLVNQPEQPPRSWRMRVSVQKAADGQAKVSSVAFVP
jgi:Mce-associated membrane protein